MKIINVFSVGFTYLFLGCCASTYGGKVTTDQLNFQKVYEINNIASDENFDRTVEWMAVTFVDSREVVELKDRDRGKIIGNGIVEFKDVVNISECKFMVTIEIKDNRFRITFSNYLWLGTSFGNIPLDKKYHVDQVNTSFLNMSDNLFNFIINYSDDTW
ncbi:MAG: DUF4468 domain-containing protein [Candidatus Marinimicrobia bacterium]|nr:DUF4468 domain-containing protein [Candidatus Neomarinimicrobiota bacterium]